MNYCLERLLSKIIFSSWEAKNQGNVRYSISESPYNLCLQLDKSTGNLQIAAICIR